MIYICADDYGLCKQSDTHIAECVKLGSLNKISMFVNTDRESDTGIFENPDVFPSLHLNLVEGKSIADPEKIPLLADGDGSFIHSFGGLLKLHFSPKRKEFEKQLSCEIQSQLKIWLNLLPKDKPLMIDSHQHVHMIPSVFSSLVKALEEEGVKADYIRIPSEPLLPYITAPSLYFSYSCVNLLKQWLLKLLFLVDKKHLKKSGAKTALFMGILFSGKMDLKRVNKILGKYKALASKKCADAEILFHPGYLKSDYTLSSAVREDFKGFYFSDNRQLEYDSVMKLNQKI